MDRLRGLMGKLFMLGYSLMWEDDWVVILVGIKDNYIYIDKTMERPIISKEYAYIIRNEYFILAYSESFESLTRQGSGEEVMLRGSMQSILEQTNTRTVFLSTADPIDYFHKREIIIASCNERTQRWILHHSGKQFSLDIDKYLQPNENLHWLTCVDTKTESYIVADITSHVEYEENQKVAKMYKRRIVSFDLDFNIIEDNTLENLDAEKKLTDRFRILASKIVNKKHM